MVIQVVTRHRYLGDFIGDRVVEKRWLAGNITGWGDSVETIAWVSQNHLQSVYEGLQKSIHHEWVFMQRVTPGIGNAFGLVEKALQETFVPDLFKGLGEGAPERGVTRLPVKQAELALPDPTQTAPESWTTSCVITGHPVTELRGQVELWKADHSAYIQEGRAAVQIRSKQRAEEAL